MAEPRTTEAGLSIATVLHDFVVNEALPGTGLDAAAFWSGFAALLAEFSPRNAALLAKRDALQAQIDAWHLARKGQAHDAASYQAFLREIGYLLPGPAPFSVERYFTLRTVTFGSSVIGSYNTPYPDASVSLLMQLSMVGRHSIGKNCVLVSRLW